MAIICETGNRIIQSEGERAIGTIIWSRDRQKQSIFPRIIKRTKQLVPVAIRRSTMAQLNVEKRESAGKRSASGSDYRINRLINSLLLYFTSLSLASNYK